MSKRVHATGFAAAAMVAAALFASPVLAATSSGDTVVAIVNGDKILKKDVMEAIKTLPMNAGADAKEIFPLVVDQIINEKLIEEATDAAKIEQTEDYKARLESIKSQLAKQVYVERLLKDKVSEGAVKSEYNKFRDENKGKQEVRARHLLVKSEEEAKQAIKDLEGGAKFEDLVKQRSADTVSAERGGDLGFFAKEDMVPEFSEAAFKLKPGSYSKEPVKTNFGWHVIKVEEKRAREVPELKQVEAAIRQKLTQDAVRGLLDKLRAQAEIKVFDMEGKPMEGNAGADTKQSKAPEPEKEPDTKKE
jgi:peptidyl-prolyl cis-trans isomerase C